ncbi:MAG: outer membrane beta-barrel protein [Gammaproteobacteria bacterium]|jgi:opacity protein-like surface antigen
MDRLSFLVLTCLLSIFISSTTYAASASTYRPCQFIRTGFYLGAAVGATDTNHKITAFNNPQTSAVVENGVVDNDGFGFRGLVGYQFNKYFAGEAGFTKFARAKGRGLNYAGGTNNNNGHIDEHAFDLTAKGIWPIVNRISLYAKLGIAYLMTRTNVSTIFSKDRDVVRPWLGAGVSFDVTKHFAFDASYNRIQSSGTIHSAEFMGIGFYWYI